MRPCRVTLPVVGTSSPAMMRASVLFPLPFAPTMPVRSSAKASVTPSNRGRPSGSTYATWSSER